MDCMALPTVAGETLVPQTCCSVKRSKGSLRQFG
jgi:hypothetical protein